MKTVFTALLAAVAAFAMPAFANAADTAQPAATAPAMAPAAMEEPSPAIEMDNASPKKSSMPTLPGEAMDNAMTKEPVEPATDKMDTTPSKKSTAKASTKKSAASKKSTKKSAASKKKASSKKTKSKKKTASKKSSTSTSDSNQ